MAVLQALADDGLVAMHDAIMSTQIHDADLQASWALIADATACIIGAQTTEAAQPVLKWARARPKSACTSAMVLGALSNVLEMDAMHVGSSIHPGTVVVPAALAVAIALGADDMRLARAVLLGTEAAIRVGRATGKAHRQRFQSTSTCAGIGAALACADLLGVRSSEALDAMGNAASVAGGLWAFLEEDTLTKQWHAGRAAAGAVVAVELAAAGLRGPHRALSGKRGFLNVLCEGGDASELGGRGHWQIHGCAYKPWPSPRPTHAAITASISARRHVSAASIKRVALTTYGLAVDLCNKQSVASSHDARFSLRYCVAAALLDGRVDFATFDPSQFDRHADLMARIDVSEDPDMSRSYPEESAATLTIALSDGRVVVEQVRSALGDPELPLSYEALNEKWRAMLEYAELASPEAAAAEISSIYRGEGKPGRFFKRTMVACPLLEADGAASQKFGQAASDS